MCLPGQSYPGPGHHVYDVGVAVDAVSHLKRRVASTCDENTPNTTVHTSDDNAEQRPDITVDATLSNAVRLLDLAALFQLTINKTDYTRVTSAVNIVMCSNVISSFIKG